MRILQVITSLEIGGAETLVVNMIPKLQALGHIVDLCVFDSKKTPLTARLRRTSPTTKIYTLGHGYYNPLYIVKLTKLIGKYDIVHTHNSSPQLFVAIASLFCSAKLVSTEHNTSNRKRQWKWYRIIESWMYNRYNHIICISNVAEEKLREYMGGRWLATTSSQYKKLTTINNGIDVNAVFEAIPNQKLLGEKGGRKAVLMVAGFRQQKDQDTIVKALCLLDKDRFEVWFAGIGIRMVEVRQLSEALGVCERVKFLGIRTDIPNVLKAADIIVMSSHWEGLSLSNIEGMAAGKPFVASDVDGLREVTKDYGILFPHGDAQALANEILRLHGDNELYQQVADRCYQRAMQFDIAKMVAEYNQVYMDLMKL
uniref:Glycosyltransferase family 4 protein n=1 Tax=Prevotella sp. GTC17253 TaxID=3236793 RepID=A0AB33IPK3_9BACT